ncbi:MAG: NTP transferase domain-containing protein [Planctomycetes bacterium]|nr:NTP transferase domain-containing protein [Planctomycetota bacterium]
MNYAVIMAGGSGVRLWPLSRRCRPKQIIDLFQKKSLLKHGVDRIKGLFDLSNIYVVTNAEYADVVAEHLPELPAENILPEPVGQDTANAIGLAAAILHKKDPQAMMAVFSADQIIEPSEPLHEAVRLAFRFLEKRPDALFTFGIKAAYAHTGFGYLKQGVPEEGIDEGVFPVEAFKEKPNKQTASSYIRSGDYCWNSGMFVWYAGTIMKQIERFLPHNFERLQTIADAWKTPEWASVLKDEFTKLERISIDYGVMERALDVYMCRLDCHWLDVGSFEVLAESIGSSDANRNVTIPDTLCTWIDSANNIVISDSSHHLIAGVNVENLLIVHTDDATLVCHRNETDRLKELVEKLQADGLGRYV